MQREDGPAEAGRHKRSTGPCYRLVVCRPEGSVEQVEVGTDPVSVGRAEDARIRLDDPRTSRHHCVFYVRGGRLHVQDQGSANGTLVNREKTSHAALTHGDEVAAGATRIRVEIAGLAGLYGVALRRATSPPLPPPTPMPLPSQQLTASPDPTNRSSADPTTGTSLAGPGSSEASGEVATSRRPEPAEGFSRGSKAVAELAASLLLETLPGDRALVLVRDGDGRLEVLAAKRRPGAGRLPAGPSLGLAEKALLSGVSIISDDAAADPALAGEEVFASGAIGALACVPVGSDDNPVGVLYVDTGPAGRGSIDHSHLHVVHGIAGLVFAALGRREPLSSPDREARLVAREREELELLVDTLEREVQRQTSQAEDRRLELALRSTELEHLREARQSLAEALRNEVQRLIGGLEERLAGLRGQLAGPEAQALEEAILDARRVARVTEDTRAVVQMEDGDFGLAARPVHAADLLDAALERNALLARISGVGLAGAGADPNLVALADPHVTARVLDTLVAFAIEATGRGGEVTLLAKQAGGRVEVAVSETGAGVRPEERERDVEKWARSTSTAARHLGASFHFCRLAAEAHGGALRLEGDRGQRRWVISLPSRSDKDLDSTLAT